MAEFIKKDKSVLTPFGDNKRYDFVVEENSKFIRYQCKTGRYRKGCVVFNIANVSKIKGKYKITKYDENQIDNFVVYCPELDKIYIVPVNTIPKGFTTKMSLRIDNPKNGQLNTNPPIKWAKNYEF